jgi:Na+/H+ antiporter NhaD/arsenite permease-like protein
LKFLRVHALTAGAGVIAIALLALGNVTLEAAKRAVDFDLLLILFALLVDVELLRVSGFLDLAVASTVRRFHSTRAFAFALIFLSGILAALVTNDVTLFIVIPFTIAASKFSEFDVEDAVVLEVIATNLIGCLTPLGNPQNLFVFHRSGWSAAQFVTVMAPFVAWCSVGLMAAVFLIGRSRPMTANEVELAPRNTPMAIAGAVCFVLVLLEIAHVVSALPAAIAATIAAAVFLRKRAFAIDYSIVPLFLFAFVIVEGARGLDIRRSGDHLYAASIVLSQVISNVPATILLSPFADGRWRELLYGVSAGGCGTIIASLANLLAWRIYVRESGRDPRFFRRLTVINFAFLAWAATGGWVLL